MTEGTTRIEAFSDGVFAIAITLLVLEIRLQHAGAHGTLLAGLLALWPYYFAFALSFFVILVTWIAHHEVIRLVHVTTHPLLLANGFVLCYATFIPFPTAILAANLAGPEITTAVTFYCGTFVIGSGLAGLSGALYTSWGQFITPSSIGLPAAAMPIVWVAFSGRSDLTATLVGSFLLLFGFQTITVYSQQAALVLMGALLLATVMLAPQGFVLGVGKLVADRWSARRRRGASPALADASRLQPDET